MAILVDFNQCCISALYAHIPPKELKNFSEQHVPLLRHIILNMLRSYKVKFGKEYGELIICTDNRSWRSDAWKYYKAHRKVARAASGINWTLIFDTIYQLMRDLQEFFPYRVLNVPNAEADDIIAVLCQHLYVVDPHETPKPILIISGDKDFVQLQRFPNVRQFSPLPKKFLKPKKNWQTTLGEHIINGDKGDGIPNIRSVDESFVKGIRQKPITEKMMKEFLVGGIPHIPNQLGDNYTRNKMLIDLAAIPRPIKESILATYQAQVPNNKGKILTYLMKHRMKGLLDNLGDF